MNKKLQGKTVLISGASSGIGAATALEFAKNGAFVIPVARNIEKLKKIVADIEKAGGKAKFFSTDISDIEQVKKLAGDVKNEIGIPDILINNAGSGIWKFIDETEYEEVSKMMAVPYFGAFYVSKAFLPDMMERNSGHIVNMTSYAGLVHFAGATAYTAARTAMVGFHNALSADLYRTKIKTSLAYFAKVSSDYWENNPGSEERLPSSQVLINIITPERAAKKIVRGVIRKKKTIVTPFMIHILNVLNQYFPRLMRFIVLQTGYRRK